MCFSSEKACFHRELWLGEIPLVPSSRSRIQLNLLITDPLQHNIMYHNYSCKHYDDVIMNAIASQITSLVIVYSTVFSDADQSKHQSSASLAFVWGIHRDRWIPRTKGQLRRKCFHLMTSSWDIDQIMSPQRHSITCPYGRTVHCHLWRFWRNMIVF